MTDTLTKKQRSYNMSRIKGKNTKPEIILRKYLFSKGLRGYKINAKLPGKPDIVFQRHNIAIFVDGCFWHKCPKHFTLPQQNMRFWKAKIEGNVKRDKLVNRELTEKGWKVIRIWEHDVRQNTKKCHKIISNFVTNE